MTHSPNEGHGVRNLRWRTYLALESIPFPVHDHKVSLNLCCTFQRLNIVMVYASVCRFWFSVLCPSILPLALPHFYTLSIQRHLIFYRPLQSFCRPTFAGTIPRPSLSSLTIIILFKLLIQCQQQCSRLLSIEWTDPSLFASEHRETLVN